MLLFERVATAANGPRFARSRRSAMGQWTAMTFAMVLSLASESCSSSSGSKGTVVPLAALSSSVPVCGSGYAHPNVCCQSGSDQAVACTELPESPFSPCDPDLALTYPDPRTCCPLSGEGSCVDVDADAGAAVTDPTTSASCASPCTVGTVPPSGPDSLPSCGNNPMGGDCECCGPGPGGLCVEYNIFSCGFALGGGPPPTCGGSAVPKCGPCPSGWQTPPGMPDLCCRTGEAGATHCFSQSGNTGL